MIPFDPYNSLGVKARRQRPAGCAWDQRCRDVQTPPCHHSLKRLSGMRRIPKSCVFHVLGCQRCARGRCGGVAHEERALALRAFSGIARFRHHTPPGLKSVGRARTFRNIEVIRRGSSRWARYALDDRFGRLRCTSERLAWRRGWRRATMVGGEPSLSDVAVARVTGRIDPYP